MSVSWPKEEAAQHLRTAIKNLQYIESADFMIARNEVAWLLSLTLGQIKAVQSALEVLHRGADE